MKEIKNIPYTNDATAQILDIYLPDDTVKSAFLYFHGGGLTGGDKSHADVLAQFLTNNGVAVISANYRMYPQAQYPDFINDAAEAAAWSYNYIRSELKCDKLYVGGSSAGGYLSMMLCFDKRYLERVGLDNHVISGYLHDAGQPTAHFNVLKNSNIDSRRIIVDQTAPLYYVGIEKEYPPMRFIVSDNDMHGRYEQTMLMLSALTHFGYKNFDHIVMHGKHCEYCCKTDKNGESIFGKMICDFIRWV